MSKANEATAAWGRGGGKSMAGMEELVMHHLSRWELVLLYNGGRPAPYQHPRWRSVLIWLWWTVRRWG